MDIVANLGQLKIWCLDTIFPIKCISCGQEKSWICQKCLGQIRPVEKNVCPCCEKNITPDGRTCWACKKNSPLDGLVVSSSYRNKTISQAVHLYKYKFIAALHEPLAELMIRSLRSTEVPLCDLVVPIPLHKKRLRWRGFNQSELLGRRICENLLPTEMALASNVVLRVKNTKSQMKLKHSLARSENIKGAFHVPNKDLVANKSILLVDDVATTGSTIFECAKALKEAGAREVFAIVIARQEMAGKY
jgi:competence protein ComFC